MNVVTLNVLRTRTSADFGLMRIAAPALEPDVSMIVFEGLPPQPAPITTGIAEVVLQGDLDGHRVYAERLPTGAHLADLDPPPSLAACIGLGIIEALLPLHEANLVHGRIMGDRVLIGIDGEVVLFGRGRMGGSTEHDRDAVCELLGELGMTMEPGLDLGSLYARMRVASDPSDRLTLRALVLENLPTAEVESHVHVQVGPTPDSLDEVQPDLGPDESTSPGLLDRWAVNTQNDEHTAELTGSISESTSPLALTLWTALAARSAHAPPDDRFSAVEGEPSRGLRALLVAEAPDSLPGLHSGYVQPFLMSIDEAPLDRSAPREDDTCPEVTPVDDDGDTAIYDTREQELRQAILRAEAHTHIAELQARIDDAERRASQAERRAEAAERASRTPTAPIPAPLSLKGLLRVEVFIAIALFGLIAWLAWRAFG